MRSFDAFFDLRLNERLSKQSIVRLVISDAITPIWCHTNVETLLCFIVFCYGLTQVHITHIFQGYITDTGAIIQLDGLVQDSSNSSALAMELLQSCTKPSNCPCASIATLKDMGKCIKQIY